MLSIPHLIIIFIVALVVFGPQKLPELARNFGKIMAEFKRATADLRGTFEDHLRELEHEAQTLEQKKLEAQTALEADKAVLRPADTAPSSIPSSAPSEGGPQSPALEKDEGVTMIGQHAADIPNGHPSLETAAPTSSEAVPEPAQDDAGTV